MIMYIHISYHVDYNPSGNLFIYIIIPVFNIAAILLLVVGQNTRDDDYSHQGMITAQARFMFFYLNL